MLDEQYKKEQTDEEKFADQDKQIVNFITQAANECAQAELERKAKNDANWQMYNGDIDWSDKAEGQAKIHLNKAGLAVDQITAQMKKGLLNFDKWLGVENRPGYEDPTGLITDTVSKRLIGGYTDAANMLIKVTDAIKNGVVESRSTIKITGRRVPVKKYYDLNGKQEMKWCLFLDVLPYKDFHTDPNGDLYEYHETTAEYHDLWNLSADKPTKDKPYKREALKDLTAFVRPEDLTDPKKKDETVSQTTNSNRKPIKVIEFWGTILGKDGLVMEYQTTKKDKDGKYKVIPLQNIVVTIANDKVVIREPELNPRWSKKSPFISTTLIRVQGAKQPKALIDAGVDLNRYQDELLSLSVDGARKAVHGAKTVRAAWLTDPSQVEGGIDADDTIFINELAPPNAEAIQTIKTGEVPNEVLSIYNLCGSVFAENVFQNEISLSGSLPDKAVKATEVAQAGASIQGIFESIASDFEASFLEPLIEEIWCEILQNADQVDDDLLMAAFEGHEMLMYVAKQRKDLDPDKLKAVLIEEFKNLKKDKRFEYAADAFKFKGKGIRSIAASAQKMQQYQGLLSIAGQNPQLLEQIQQGVSIPKLFKQLVKSAGLDLEEIDLTPEEIEQQFTIQRIKEEILQKASMEGGQGQPAPAQGNAAVSPGNAPGIPEGMEPGNNGQGAI